MLTAEQIKLIYKYCDIAKQSPTNMNYMFIKLELNPIKSIYI